jgi:NAD(P)-dependent dehydrogenase (short-subunit alcohol dehydrogenase family)
MHPICAAGRVLHASTWTPQGKTALVIGGTSGIGYATATKLASLGATLVVVGRDAARGSTAVAAMQQSGNLHSTFIQADLG